MQSSVLLRAASGDCQWWGFHPNFAPHRFLRLFSVSPVKQKVQRMFQSHASHTSWFSRYTNLHKQLKVKTFFVTFRLFWISCVSTPVLLLRDLEMCIKTDGGKRTKWCSPFCPSPTAVMHGKSPKTLSGCREEKKTLLCLSKMHLCWLYAALCTMHPYENPFVTGTDKCNGKCGLKLMRAKLMWERLPIILTLVTVIIPSGIAIN